MEAKFKVGDKVHIVILHKIRKYEHLIEVEIIKVYRNKNKTFSYRVKNLTEELNYFVGSDLDWFDKVNVFPEIRFQPYDEVVRLWKLNIIDKNIKQMKRELEFADKCDVYQRSKKA